MIEVVFRGRGGQGAVIASKLLAIAFHLEGKYVQSFPQYGGERRGAPVAAFLRVDEREIALRCNIYKADRLVVLDETLPSTVTLNQGLKDGGWILLNTGKPVDHFAFGVQYRLACIDAGRIAVEEGLGSLSQPIVNTAVLGAYARITEEVSLESILAAIDEEVPHKPKANREAAKKAFDLVTFRS
ncbi:MAG: 2-oxoacid:acceptor oxidoreductase family protein [Deltaproteobacteria bacterium]|nr:2-oxoacid:acceptor oxidoreductase family protein [Deltaproteobacteria bacterium]MBW2306695.1 2-oxoacid:acceptor oxidoreductase family protein [Deltaproteobacteria bacterium]